MTAPHPHAIKMELEAKLQELGATVVNLHSVLLEDGVVHVGYDVTDAGGDWTMFYDFPKPAEVGRDHAELAAFSRWLATADHCCCGSVH